MKAVVAGESGDLGAIKGWTGRYLAVLGFALRHPAKIVIAAVLVLVAVVVAYGSLGRGVEFFPDVEPNKAVVQVHARGNLAVEERDAMLRQVEAVVLAITAGGAGSQRGGDTPGPQDIICTP